jgi:hypothetical protein
MQRCMTHIWDGAMCVICGSHKSETDRPPGCVGSAGGCGDEPGYCPCGGRHYSLSLSTMIEREKNPWLP